MVVKNSLMYYNFFMKKLLIILIVLSFLFSCFYIQENKNLKIYVNLKKKGIDKASLLVFNFKEPSYATDKGKIAASIFHKYLLKSKKFHVISINNNSAWIKLGETEEERLKNAIQIGKKSNYDYILVGELFDYIYANVSKSKVGIKIRIIDTKREKTVYFAEDSKQEEGIDPSFPLDTKLTDKSKKPEILIEEIAKEIISKI